MVTTTRVLVFNGNSNNWRDMRDWIERKHVDICLICETGSLAPVYRGMGRLYAGDEQPIDPSVLVLRNGPMRARTRQLTQRVYGLPQKPNLWRDRHLVSVIDPIRREFNISTHANALLHDDGKWKDNDGALEWRNHGLPKLAEEIHRGKRWGRKVRVGADMNFPDRGPDTPRDFFRRLGLSTISDGVMWFAYDRNRETVLDWSVLPTPPGADAHKALLIELENR